MGSRQKKIAYYITPHGFGHAVRSLEVIRHLLQLDPDLHVVIVSDLPDFLVSSNVGRALPQRRKRLDVGLVQIDSLRFNLEATHAALKDLFRRREMLIAEESEFLRSERVQAVVSDVSFLAFTISKRCGLPALGIGNFTWDWIYESYAASDPRWNPLVEWIRRDYSSCDLFLRLPMHGDCSSCPNIMDVPLVARKAQREPVETRSILGCHSEQKAYLLSFIALDLGEAAKRRIEGLDGTILFYKRPLRLTMSNGRSLDPYASLAYTDVVAAVDGVITKPGYGIVSDCLAHGTPILYTDRGYFPEYDILVQAIEQYLAAAYISQDDFISGRWESALRRLEERPRRMPDMRTDGASVCARIILDRIESG